VGGAGVGARGKDRREYWMKEITKTRARLERRIKEYPPPAVASDEGSSDEGSSDEGISDEGS
jgi:hypothetical protein